MKRLDDQGRERTLHRNHLLLVCIPLNKQVQPHKKTTAVQQRASKPQRSPVPEEPVNPQEDEEVSEANWNASVRFDVQPQSREDCVNGANHISIDCQSFYCLQKKS